MHTEVITLIIIMQRRLFLKNLMNLASAPVVFTVHVFILNVICIVLKYLCVTFEDTGCQKL